MFVVCEKWVKRRMDCYINQSSSSTITALLSHLGWVAQPWVTEGRQALSLPAGSYAGLLSLTDSNRPSTWLYYFLRPPASAVLPLIYTGSFLDWRLGRGSIYYVSPLENFTYESVLTSPTVSSVSGLLDGGLIAIQLHILGCCFLNLS